MVDNKMLCRYDIFSEFEESEQPEFIEGNGASLYDEDGNRYLNMLEMCVCLGENHPSYQKQMIRAFGNIATARGRNRQKERLFENLMRSTHGEFRKIYLAASGSELAEWSVKFARKLMGKTEVVSFWNSIHGRTSYSASMSGLPGRKTGYGPIEGGHVFMPYPKCSECRFHCECSGGEFYCIRFLEEKIKYESTQDVAAVIIEPIQGYDNTFPPTGFLKALRTWTSERNIVLIFDEIQSGTGRSGSMYRYQEEGVVPDILLLGKALGNGMHIAAALLKEVPEKKDLTAAFGGCADDAPACAAANVVLEELMDGGLLEHIRQMGEYILEGLRELGRQFPAVMTEVRGSGMIIAFECSQEEDARKIKAGLDADRIFTGQKGKTIVLKPVYTLTKEEVNIFLESLGKILQDNIGKNCKIDSDRVE